MATIPTQDAVPSESPRDLKFNAGKIDEFVTSLVNTYIDRFGHEHYTIEGLRWLAQQAIAQYGWIPVGTFQAGATLTTPNQILKDTTDGEYYRWDGVFPKTVATGSTPASTGGTGVGAWLSVGDSTLRSWVNNNISINFSTVTNMIAGTAISGNTIPLINGMVATTFANQFGIKQESKWLISSTQDANTYSVLLANGGYANLICRADMNYAEFGFGGTDVQNVAAVDEGNRVARAQAVVRSLSFPAGAYSIGSYTLDVDKRGFIWDGAGLDVSVLNSTSSGISMHHIGYDIRDRSRDRFHQDQIVRGFTIDGGVGTRGAAAADRVVLGANYGHWAFKSGNHRSSCLDFCCIVGEFTGKTAGTVNGATRTLNGARIRGNSVKMFGGFYLQGSGQSGSAAVNINAPKTTLSGNVAAGASTIPVTNASEFLQYDIIEIQGNSGLDAKRITGISGNILTLDSPLTYAHEIGKAVYVDTWGNSLTGGTIESGEIQIGNCKGLSITGMYVEKSKLYVYNQPESMSVTGNYFGQTTHQIDNPSNFSSFNIEDNYTDTQMEVNIADRNGSINGIIDLYEFPNMKINNLTRSQNSIIVNGAAAFKSLNVEKYYDSSTNGVAFTSFKFTGFSAASAVSTSTEILRFAQNTATIGYDGHSYDITAVIRRATGLSGLIKRAGQTSIIGSTISDTSAANSRTLNNYAFADPTNGMDLIVGSNTGRMGIVLKGEPVGGQAIKAMLSGEVISVLPL
ncbi:hypothetical protein [Lelliottia amnigena]|uniref:tail fiber/spike domain-containing protein n=1 Tax=Lelliottia amnigena TaxID=61646 RepID=UPI001C5C933B|nr:hypothetical protein [Lelliottia amnigena]MCE9967130.1 hypothetical protein [Lelliottia amnigena]QXZ17680.1 hypothetical protein I6L75_11010 [Lelliottia amnigena]